MAKYIFRTCPKCRDYLGVVLNEPPRKGYEMPIFGYCAMCGFQLKGWRLILGRKRMANTDHGRLPKAFG